MRNCVWLRALSSRTNTVGLDSLIELINKGAKFIHLYVFRTADVADEDKQWYVFSHSEVLPQNIPSPILSTNFNKSFTNHNHVGGHLETIYTLFEIWNVIRHTHCIPIIVPPSGLSTTLFNYMQTIGMTNKRVLIYNTFLKYSNK